jgi:hypothetical protein
MDCDVPGNELEATKAMLLSGFFDRLLPSIKATAIRDTSRKPT